MKSFALFDAPQRRAGRFNIVIVATLLCVAGGLALCHARYAELSFDGAMNMQVARSRIAHGRYATSYNALRDFSPAVQTGVTLLFPAELAIRTLGTTALAAQLPNVAYLILALLMSGVVMRGLVPCALIPVAVLLLICTPELLTYGMGGYGEVPGLFYLLACMACLAPRPGTQRLSMVQTGSAGLLMGLAYLTKTVMLIALPALGIAMLYDLFVSRRLVWQALAILVLAALLPVAAYEACKLHVLGAEGYQAWWGNQSGSIMAQAGVSNSMLDTPGFWPKLAGHLDILGGITHLSRLELVLFLVAPYATLALCVAVPALRDGTAIPTHLIILTGTALTYLSWWLLMTPTSRAWARRIMPGLMLHELVTLIALVVAARVLARRFSAHEPTSARHGASHALRSALTIILAATLTHATVAGAARIRIAQPSPSGLTDAAVIGASIRELDPDARIYAQRWWQAPTVAYYSDRMFRDIHEVPQSRFNDHARNYFVVDDRMREYAPYSIQAILDRSDHELVRESHPFALYRINHLYRYPQFTDLERAGRLPELVDFREGSYEYVRALQRGPNGFFWSRGLTALLLQHGGQTRLRLVLWFPKLSGYEDLDLTIKPLVDGYRLDPVQVTHDGIIEVTLALPQRFRQAQGPIAVELHFSKTWYQPDPALGVQRNLYVILIAGFVDPEA